MIKTEMGATYFSIVLILIICSGSLFAEVSTKRVIDAYDGLNMRDAPGLEGNIITTIPGGVSVELISEEEAILHIGGRVGRWSEVEWRNIRGWVYGGYLAIAKDREYPWAAIGIPYRAEHSRGRYGTDGGSYTKEEILFTGGNQVKFVKTVHFFDGRDIATHFGWYYIEENRIVLVLGDGNRETIIHEDFGPSPPPGSQPPVPGYSMMLVWDEDEDGFPRLININDYEEVEWVGGYTYDPKDKQFKKEDDQGFRYIGYFYQSGK